MRDIPVFTTENGVGSLVLREIPYKSIAYVKVQDVSDLQAFVSECVSFCRAVGTEAVYASGHEDLASYPFYTAIWEMSLCKDSVPETDAAVFPVTEHTLETWREIYNQRMEHVPNASYMSREEAQQMLLRGDGYFVHKEQNLLGIGIISAERMDALAAVKPGAGRTVACALIHALAGDTVVLEVASENNRAVKLYHELGFLPTREISRWYKIF